jgi:hypothetical protein
MMKAIRKASVINTQRVGSSHRHNSNENTPKMACGQKIAARKSAAEMIIEAVISTRQSR